MTRRIGTREELLAICDQLDRIESEGAGWIDPESLPTLGKSMRLYIAELEHLVSCVLTVSKENTEEWMEYIPEEINRAAVLMGETDRAAYDARRGTLRIVRGTPQKVVSE